MNSNKPMPTFFWILIGSAGGLVALLGTCFMLSRLDFLSNAKKTEGRVTSVESYVTKRKLVRDGAGNSTHYTKPQTRYKLVVSYDVEGRDYSLKTEQSFPSPPRKNGAVVVAYNPDAPEEALIEQTSELWFLPLFFIGIGLFFVAVAWFGYDYERRRRHLYPSQ